MQIHNITDRSRIIYKFYKEDTKTLQHILQGWKLNFWSRGGGIHDQNHMKCHILYVHVPSKESLTEWLS